MRRIRLVLVAASLVVLAAIAINFYAADEGAQAVDEAWKKAMLANDIEAIVACYAPDAVAWFPGAPEAKGTAAIREGYRSLLGPNKVTAASTSDTHYETVGKNSVGWGRFSMTLTPTRGGQPTTMTGRFTEVSAMRNGKWVYIVDHASADPAPAAAPSAH